jgi:hypothetical protein
VSPIFAAFIYASPSWSSRYEPRTPPLFGRRLPGYRDGRANSDYLLPAEDGGAEGAEEVVMSKVVLDVSMSLDGFIAGPNVREAEPMGDGGERLHAWMAGNGPDAQIDIGVRREVDATVGATVIGRRTFDLGVGPWGGTPWPGMPSFVVTHRTRPDLFGKNGSRRINSDFSRSRRETIQCVDC